MRRLRAKASPWRWGIASIAALGVAWALVMHATGWTQTSNYAQVRALAAGHAEIDRWQWQTGDKAWLHGHFYSVKAPGLAVITLPVYLALDGVGGQSAARWAADNAAAADHPRWTPTHLPGPGKYGGSVVREIRTKTQVENETPMIWVLTLFGAVLPAIALLLLVRWVAERMEPGFGTVAAITLGLGTIVMTFGSEFFSHVASATLGFGAFFLLFRERLREPRIAVVAAAGLAAGLAVSFEYPLGLLAAILLAYALARPDRLRRGAVYIAGAVVGAAPALAFNWWALGSPFRFAYSHAVAVPGHTGHALLGLNSGGFFGIGLPRLDGALDLLFSGRGIITLTPILVMGAIGIVLIRRRGWVAEANVIAAVAIAFFVYNAGYWLPLGGGSPGPRFLTPILPFLAIGLAFAYRRFTALTLALAIPSVATMLAGSLTYPLIGENGTGTWINDFGHSVVEHTVLTVVGVQNGWLAAAPVLLAIAAGITFCVLATPQLRLGRVWPALVALGAWAVLAVVGPSVAGDPLTPLDGDPASLTLVAGAAFVAVATLLVLRYLERRGSHAASPVAIPGASADGVSQQAT
jgi:hypothetical protein